MTAYRFLEPLDVLFLRGNKLFGEAGSHGESLIPPWPSVAAGAIRSQILAEEGIDLGVFARGEIEHPAIGTPEKPGQFRIGGFHLARRDGEGVETLHPLPADLVAQRKDDGSIALKKLSPARRGAGIDGSFPLEQWPVLASDEQAKPAGGIWLGQAGWEGYLRGELPGSDTLVQSDDLWRIDTRTGIGLNADRRSVEEGMLFTVQAVALNGGCGFLVAVDGAEPPAAGTLRLGGDGRAASVQAVDYRHPEPDYGKIIETGRCRLVLTSPGIFREGWLPAGITRVDDGYRFELHGVRGRLVCAAVPRAEVISGWDLARWQPKPAQRVAPAGSVYWVDELEADPDRLRKLVDHGLWPEDGYDAGRRAEGFNRVLLAAW